MRDEFLSTVARELGMSLSLMKVISKGLLTRTLDEAYQKRLLERINEQATYMLDVMADWQDLLHIEAEKKIICQFAPVDLFGLVNNLTLPVGALTSHKQLQIIGFSTNGPRLQADPFWLPHAIQTILSFAAEKSSAGSTIVMRQQSFGEAVELIVEFETSDEPFHADKMARADGPNSALNLPVAWFIFKLHQGKIRIESPSKGQRTIYVTLPLSQGGLQHEGK